MAARKVPDDLDATFYKPAETFFPAYSNLGLTFDDVTLATLYSEVLPRETQLDTILAEGLDLKIPIISSSGLSPLEAGKEMIPESVPHALSLLWFHLGEGTLENVRCEWADLGGLIVRFRYSAKSHPCEVAIKLVRKGEQPREFQFGFNHKIVTRKLDLRNYDIYFNYGDKRLRSRIPLGFR